MCTIPKTTAPLHLDIVLMTTEECVLDKKGMSQAEVHLRGSWPQVHQCLDPSVLRFSQRNKYRAHFVFAVQAMSPTKRTLQLQLQLQTEIQRTNLSDAPGTVVETNHTSSEWIK